MRWYVYLSECLFKLPLFSDARSTWCNRTLCPVGMPLQASPLFGLVAHSVIAFSGKPSRNASSSFPSFRTRASVGDSVGDSVVGMPLQASPLFGLKLLMAGKLPTPSRNASSNLPLFSDSRIFAVMRP